MLKNIKNHYQLTNYRIFITITPMMIDIHCHILPGLDDGAKDMEESVCMCAMAAEDGIEKIVATPHTMDGIYINKNQDVKHAVNVLNTVLIEKKIPLEILPGADVHVNIDLLELLKEGKASTINDNHHYLLLELPHQSVPPNIKDLIFDLTIHGITPILTHPERNMVLQNEIDTLYDLVLQGILIQITAHSLRGEFGPAAEKCCFELLKHNLVHVIATDAHSSTVRPPYLSYAFKKAAEIIDEKEALALVTSNPSAIIKGQNIPNLLEPAKPKKSFFQRLFS